MCAEIYGTGRANLPGSTRERDLLYSFSRMLPELLRHSDRPDVLDLIKDEALKLAHRPRVVERDDAPAGPSVLSSSSSSSSKAPAHASTSSKKSLWDEDDAEELQQLFGGDGTCSGGSFGLMGEHDDEDDELLLDNAGF